MFVEEYFGKLFNNLINGTGFRSLCAGVTVRELLQITRPWFLWKMGGLEFVKLKIKLKFEKKQIFNAKNEFILYMRPQKICKYIINIKF